MGQRQSYSPAVAAELGGHGQAMDGAMATTARGSLTPGILVGAGVGRHAGREAQIREKGRLEQELESDRLFFADPPDDFIRCPQCNIVYAVNTSRSAGPDLGLTLMIPACYSKDMPRGANLSFEESLRHMHRSRFRCAQCSVDFCRCSATPYHWGWSCDGWQKNRQLAEQVCPVGSCRWCHQPCMARMRRCESLAMSCCGSDEGTDLKRFPPSLSCAEKERRACGKRHECGHWCGGLRGEARCPPCLHATCRTPSASSSALVASSLAAVAKQKLPNVDEWCAICWTESLGAAPVVHLTCGHVVHHHCADTMVRKGNVGGRRLTFKNIKCPLCQVIMRHPSFDCHVVPEFNMYQKVRRKAVQRWVVEQRGPAPRSNDVGDEDAIAVLAIQKMNFFECSQCNEPYYGGEVECGGRDDEEQDLDEDVQAALAMELVCRGCASKGQRQCPEHGTEFLGWKCRYCCEHEAHYFCFGTTHFCHVCHDVWQSGVEQRRKLQVGRPCLGKGRCILGGRHPQVCKNGRDEYALGCSICAQDAESGIRAVGDKRISPLTSGKSCMLM